MTNIDETAAGLHIGCKVTDKVGLWGVAPVVQPAHADQADQGALTATVVVTTNLQDGSANNTHEALTTLTDYTPHAAGAVTVTSNSATDLDTVATALETLRDEQLAVNDSISKNLDKNSDEINALITDVAAIDTLLTSIRTALVNSGVMKGAA